MWWHDYDYRDTRRHMRLSAGGGWWGTDEKPATVVGRPKPDITPERLQSMWDELDAVWRREVQATGDTSKALKAVLARKQVMFREAR